MKTVEHVAEVEVGDVGMTPVELGSEEDPAGEEDAVDEEENRLLRLTVQEYLLVCICESDLGLPLFVSHAGDMNVFFTVPGASSGRGAANNRRGRSDRRGGRGRGRGDDGDGRNRRQSLRIGTSGKKGRSAELSRRRGSLKKRDRSAAKAAREEAAIERRTVQLPEGPISVGTLAEILDEKPAIVIKFLMTDLGVMAGITQNLDPATCVAVAEGFGRIVGEDEDDEYDE